MVALSECHLGVGNMNDAVKLAHEALAMAESSQDNSAKCMATLAYANATLFKDPTKAVELAMLAADRFQAMRDKKGHARALLAVANGQKIPEQARKAAKDAASLFREVGDKAGQAAALHAFMNAELIALGPESALAVADDVLRLAKEAGEKKAEVAVMNSISSMHLMRGGSYEAVKVATDAFGVCKTFADPSSFTDTLASIFSVQFSWNSPDEAAGLAGQAVQVFNETLDKRGLALALQMLAIAQLKRQNYSEAVSQAKGAVDICKGLKDGTGLLKAVTTLITVYANCKPAEPLLMLESAKDAVVFFKDAGDKRGAAAALHLVAATQYATHSKKTEPKEARSAAEAAIAFYRSLDDYEGQVAVLRTVVYANLAKGQLDEALRAVKDLVSLHQAKGDSRAEVRALDALANLHLAKDNVRKALKVAQEALTAAKDVDHDIELDVMRTLVSVYFLKKDAEGALNTTQDMLAMYQKMNDRSGEASAMLLLFRVYQLSGMDDEGLKTAYEALAIQRELENKRGQLRIMELLASTLLDKKAYAEAAEVAMDALTLTRELQLHYSQACAIFTMAKTNIASTEGATYAGEAARIFREGGHLKEAATAYHAVANGILLMRGPARDAIGAAAEGLNLYKETGDKQGEAVMLHTIANCQLALRETDNAINSAYEALAMFDKCGDKYGVGLAKKFLVGTGQTEEAIKEWRDQQLATFDGVETRVVGETDEDKRRMEDEARDLNDQQVLWELAWIPWETQDPKNFGEKSPPTTRRVFVAGEMQDKGMLKKLMKVRPNKSAAGTPYFSNLLNGRLLNKDTLQFGITASQCLSIVYDVSKLNHHGPLEVIDLVLKICQAFIPIEERKIALDLVTTSCQNLAWTAGLQEPFHATLWGFCRAARNENPMHEFRLLDVDPARRTQSMAFICRYLMGAQTTRPAEAICRNGGLMVSRLVGARTKLNLPVRIELENRF
uniref:Uncharacterized protein n=1 Tax=Alexandrium catenella TaxID=2925 RepID=A0A7S1PVM3_ALECA